MTKINQLSALPRTSTGKEFSAKLRTEGRIPAVVYGKGMEARAITLDQQETENLFQKIAVENTIVDLLIEGEKEPLQTLIREVQTPPHKVGVLHVDFLRIQKGVAVEVEIPVRLEGVPVGVRDSGGVLEQVINEIRVKCIPSKIPDAIHIDVTALGIGDSLHVSDVDLGEGVEILVDPERTLCNVAIPRVVAADVEAEEELEEVAELEEGEEAPPEAAGEEAPAGEEEA